MGAKKVRWILGMLGIIPLALIFTGCGFSLGESLFGAGISSLLLVGGLALTNVNRSSCEPEPCLTFGPDTPSPEVCLTYSPDTPTPLVESPTPDIGPCLSPPYPDTPYPEVCLTYAPDTPTPIPGPCLSIEDPGTPTPIPGPCLSPPAPDTPTPVPVPCLSIEDPGTPTPVPGPCLSPPAPDTPTPIPGPCLSLVDPGTPTPASDTPTPSASRGGPASAPGVPNQVEAERQQALERVIASGVLPQDVADQLKKRRFHA